MSEYRVVDELTGAMDAYDSAECALSDARLWANDMAAEGVDAKIVVQRVTVEDVVVLDIAAPEMPLGVVTEIWLKHGLESE